MAYSEKRDLRPRRLEIESVLKGTTHLLSLRGELDADGCRRVATELKRAEANGAQLIVVDLSELVFIDSTGIALLVAAMRRSEQDSGRLRLIPSESEDVQRLLDLCGLSGRLPFLQDSESRSALHSA